MDWDAVDRLIRELGALRVVANSFPPGTTARGQVEKAILDGAEAINVTIRNPRDGAAVARARAALATARDEVSRLGTPRAVTPLPPFRALDLTGAGAYTPREP